VPLSLLYALSHDEGRPRRRSGGSEERRRQLSGALPARPARRCLLSDSCSSARGFAPRCFQPSPRGRGLAVCLGRYDQLPGGLSPPSHRSCWAHSTTASAGVRWPCGLRIESSTTELRWRPPDAPGRAWRPTECRVRAPSRPGACGAFSAPLRVAPAWHFRVVKRPFLVLQGATGRGVSPCGDGISAPGEKRLNRAVVGSNPTGGSAFAVPLLEFLPATA
jgi:hypothetical protein